MTDLVSLYRALRPFVSDQTLRESILAAHGDKVSRLCIEESLVIPIVEILEQHGVYVALHDKKYIISADQGKGGWVSGYGVEADADDVQSGFFHLYVALNAEDAWLARWAEHSNDYDGFGRLLGYPACCRQFYDRYLKIAEEAQGDFVLPMVQESMAGRSGLPIFPARLNVTLQYFSGGFISFYPCSFFCQAAKEKVDEAMAVMHLCDPDWVLENRRASLWPVLYTEFDGIFRFNEASRSGNTVRYDSLRLEACGQGVLHDLLMRGDTLEIIDVHHVIVRHGTSVVADLFSDTLAMLLFEDDYA